MESPPKSMTHDEAQDRAAETAGNLTGRRIKLHDGRLATIISSYCCVADRHSGHVHLDGTPFEKIVVANWVDSWPNEK